METPSRLKDFLNFSKNYNFSIINEERIFLIGSIKFQEYFIKIESILQLKFLKTVSICCVDGLLNKDKYSKKEWDILQSVALKKLQYNECVLVLDVNGYIGEETKEEIELAKSLKKGVYYLSKMKK